MHEMFEYKNMQGALAYIRLDLIVEFHPSVSRNSTIIALDGNESLNIHTSIEDQKVLANRYNQCVARHNSIMRG